MIIYKKNISYQIHRNSKHKNNKSLNNNNNNKFFIYLYNLYRKSRSNDNNNKKFLINEKDTYYNMLYKLQ